MPALHTSALLQDDALRVAVGNARPAYSKKAPVDSFFMFDIYHGGRGRVSGTVKVKGTPDYAVRRRVRLIRDRDGKMIREMWSDATTGAYQFDYVDERERYTVLAYDYSQAFRAVVADNLLPEVIP